MHHLGMRPKNSRALLEIAKTGAFLVTEPLNIRYLSGVRTDAGVLLVTPRRFTLFLDGRRLDRSEQSARQGIWVRDITDLPKALKDEPECGFEADKVTVLRKAGWKRNFSNTKFVPKVGVVEEFRRGKEEDEVRFIRRAQRITKEILRRIPVALRVGITEERLARQLDRKSVV